MFFGGFSAPAHGLCGNDGRLPSQSRLPPCQLPQRGSQVGALLKVCAKLSLASPFGGGGLALARTERASCQRPPRMGCVEALAGCPLSHGCRRASVSAAASVGRWATSHRDVAAPEGGAKSRLPLWGALVPSGHRSALDRAGRRECPRRGRRGQPASGAHVRWPLDEHERSELPWARIDSGGTPPSGKSASLFP